MAGAGGAWRLYGAHRGGHSGHRWAGACDRGIFAPLWRACGSGRGRFRRYGAAASPSAGVPSPLSQPHLAAQGMDPSAARSLADLADADADPLPAAAGAAALGHIPHRARRIRRADSRYRDGGRPARRWARLADHFRRGRAGSCVHCARRQQQCSFRQNRGRHWHDHFGFRADSCFPGI